MTTQGGSTAFKNGENQTESGPNSNKKVNRFVTKPVKECTAKSSKSKQIGLEDILKMDNDKALEALMQTKVSRRKERQKIKKLKM